MKIENRKGQNLAVLVEQSKSQKGLVFIEHGYGGFKEQKHIQIFAEAFKEKRFTIVLFDTTKSLGESGGNIKMQPRPAPTKTWGMLLSGLNLKTGMKNPFGLLDTV